MHRILTRIQETPRIFSARRTAKAGIIAGAVGIMVLAPISVSAAQTPAPQSGTTQVFVDETNRLRVNAGDVIDPLLQEATGPGVANRIRVDVAGGDFIVSDTADTVAAGPRSGCTAVDSNSVRCPTTGITQLRVDGGELNDEIVLTQNVTTDSVVSGGPGSDSLYGGAAMDTIWGDGASPGTPNPGNDTIHGGSGSDRLFGEAGSDRLYGDEGNDPLLQGGEGRDYLFGGDGDDRLVGHAGNDYVHGGDGSDGLEGDSSENPAPGNDVLDSVDGVNGNDRLYGGAQTDRCTTDGFWDRAGACEDLFWFAPFVPLPANPLP